MSQLLKIVCLQAIYLLVASEAPQILTQAHLLVVLSVGWLDLLRVTQTM